MEKVKAAIDIYQQPLNQLFGEMSDSQLMHVLNASIEIELEAGHYVIHQGEIGDSFYIVISGRFRVLQKTENGIYILGDIPVGDPIGEFSLFTKEAYAASVVALRKSTILRLKYDDYLKLVKQFPEFATSLTKIIINRLKRNSFQQKMGACPKNIVVINLQPKRDVSQFTNEIQNQLQIMGFEINIYDHFTNASPDKQLSFDEMEKQDGINFLVCTIEEMEWTNLCLAYCDLIIVATHFNENHDLYHIEEQLFLYKKNVLNKKIHLLLLHPENAPFPQQTKRWLKNRNVELHMHMRQSNLYDTRRFCRIITHQAVGLVLGGGGARGFAHVGVTKALLETGFEFDFIGGTSIGGIFSVALSLADFDVDKVKELCKLAVKQKITSNDFTLPMVSLMSGKKMRKYLFTLFGDAEMEDMWINTFCVSTNYSNATLKVHEKGLARIQTEASAAIPGVFPPVLIDKHLHIDGGVVDNLPVEAMYTKPVSHIVAISLSAETTIPIHLEKIPTPWSLFWNKFGRKERTKIPGFSTILINSVTINSRHKQQKSIPNVSIFLELDLKEYSFLEWGKWEQLIQKGYEQTKVYLSNVKDENKFWKRNVD